MEYQLLVPLGAILGPSWGPLGPSWRLDRRLDKPRQRKTREAKGREGKGRGRERIARERCGKVWRGRFCGRGGGVRQTLRVRPPQDPRPSPPRGVGDSYCDFFGNLVALLFCIVFRCLFGSILAPVSLPTCRPKSIKIQEKSMPRCHPSWTPFFDRFLVGFGS